jgi:hypothetical protein
MADRSSGFKQRNNLLKLFPELQQRRPARAV